MDINESLRQHRISRNISRQELATLLGISVRTYQTYETGTREPSMTSFIKMADFYRISLDELVGRDFSQNSLVDS